ncbi:hypothetical protein WMF11_38025 [Sorangium sp. So ce295]|uniref:GapS1 family protein n=1 Tax=Sorangium sp. So ce295 TaxID=3133295 RepID=UPI003F60A69D
MLLSQQLRDKRYAKVAKRVHDAIRLYSGTELLANVVSRIHRQKERDVDEWRAQPPWLLLLLLKWIILYGSFGPIILRRVTDQEVDKLVNLMHGVDNASNQPKEHDNIRLFMRAIAYQQFLFQDPITLARIARQALLFRDLPSAHPLGTMFLAAKGVTLDDWIELSFMLASGFLSSPRATIRDSYFDGVRKRHSSEVTSAFLSSYSRTLPELRQYLQGVTLHKPQEFRERSPMLAFPLLRRADDLLCFSPQILLKSIEDHIYDTLRAADTERFMKHFGRRFEIYVRGGLQFLCEDFIDEKQLQSTFGSGKVTDFALIRDRSVLLIDAKGVDIGFQGMTTPSATTVVNRTRTSIIKALIQGEECGRRVLKQLGSRELFLLVVTYKQLYFGTGADFVSSIGAQRITQEGYDPTTAALRPENVYFVAIDEFDHLMSALHHDGVALTNFITQTRDLDSDPGSKSYVMKMHLVKRHPTAGFAPMYLQHEFDAMMKRISEAFDVDA